MPISFRHWASFPLANDTLTKRVTLTRSRERDLRRIFEWQRVAESAARWLATSRLLPLSSTQQPAIQLEGVEARAFVDCALVFFPQKEFVLSSVHTDCEIDTNEIDQFLRLLLQKTWPNMPSEWVSFCVSLCLWTSMSDIYIYSDWSPARFNSRPFVWFPTDPFCASLWCVAPHSLRGGLNAACPCVSLFANGFMTCFFSCFLLFQQSWQQQWREPAGHQQQNLRLPDCPWVSYLFVNSTVISWIAQKKNWTCFWQLRRLLVANNFLLLIFKTFG